jgi:hypothetical protein
MGNLQVHAGFTRETTANTLFPLGSQAAVGEFVCDGADEESLGHGEAPPGWRVRCCDLQAREQRTIPRATCKAFLQKFSLFWQNIP